MSIAQICYACDNQKIKLKCKYKCLKSSAEENTLDKSIFGNAK